MLIQLLIIQVLAFAGIIFVLRFLLYRHMNSAVKRLKELQAENQQKETQLRAELDRAKKEARAQIEKGKEEAKKIIETAVKTGEILKRNLEDKGKLEVEKITAQGEEKITRLKDDIQAKAKATALDIALEIIKYTLTEESIKIFHHQLINEIIEEIMKIDKEKFSMVTSEKITVSCSFALLDAEKEKLKQVLAQQMDKKIDLDEKIDESIIGGLSVAIGAFVIDGSLKNKLSKAAKYIKTRQVI
ncbi:MAG: F0F1 ATP synthase subunit delta [Candidatus Omnitrophota bacterium]